MGFPSVDLDTIGHGGNGCKAVPGHRSACTVTKSAVRVHCSTGDVRTELFQPVRAP